MKDVITDLHAMSKAAVPNAPAEKPITERESTADWPFTRELRAIRRISLSCLWTLVASLPQLVLMRLAGKGKIRFARFYWATICRILGLKVVVRGEIAGQLRDRYAARNGIAPVIFVANHSSWLDIAVTGGILPTVFVAKQQISDWPVIGTLARLGRTLFVSRQRNNTGRELHAMTERIEGEDNLILFPEGTSSDGTRVLPFMSSFFAVAKPTRSDDSRQRLSPVLIQPLSIVYDRLEGKSLHLKDRSILAWYGDMDLAPHIWSVTKWRSLGATVILHPPVDPKDFVGRKELSTAVQAIIAKGVADLQQRTST